MTSNTLPIAHVSFDGSRPTPQEPKPEGLAEAATPLAIRIERDIDYAATAAMADEGFGVPAGSFKPQRLRWLYERAFAQGSTILGVYAGERKVGQVVLIHQSVSIGGRQESAVALVDLFILKAFRSRQTMADLYGDVERYCRASATRFILAVPNPSGARVNVRYLKLTEFLKLDVRAGFCAPWRGRGVTVSASLASLGQDETTALFERYLPTTAAGLSWTPQALWARFEDPEAHYGVNASDSLLLISAPRTTRGVSHTLVCAMLAKPGATVHRRDMRALTRAACALHRRPIFVYAGINQHVPLPGWSLPERLRPSPMVVQSRDFQAPETPAAFSRFELLDFDFA